MSETCATCPAYRPDEIPEGDMQSGAGSCHAKIPVADGLGVATWPRVFDDEWCMEHPKLAGMMRADGGANA